MRTLSLTVIGLLAHRDARARAGGAAPRHRRRTRRSAGRTGSAGACRSRRTRRPTAPPSRRASPTTRKAGAIRSSACCAAASDARAGTGTAAGRPRRARRRRSDAARHGRAASGGFVGILQGADRKTYIVRAGDRLFDGTIRSITADAMVILQQVNDPLSLEKQREVRKVLRQTEEAK